MKKIKIEEFLYKCKYVVFIIVMKISKHSYCDGKCHVHCIYQVALVLFF